MYTGIKHLHSGLAWLVLAALFVAIVYNLSGYLSKNPFTEKNRKIALVGLIAAHSQLVAGLIMYFVSPLGMENFSGAGMKDPLQRLYMLEHPIINILAIVLITVGYSRAKRLKLDSKRFASILIFYTLGLIFILSRIPWQVWPS